LRQQWVLPPKANAGFVAAMEDVLEVYAQPYDPKRPQVCFDEGGKQLIGEVRPPLPVRPGSPRREDYEYERNGTANLFMVFEPLAGVRRVEVTERRTNQDFARIIRRLVDEWYAQAEKIVLVLDNLSTHTPAALYEAFEPTEARRLVEKLEWHYTPQGEIISSCPIIGPCLIPSREWPYDSPRHRPSVTEENHGHIPSRPAQVPTPPQRPTHQSL
jgi:hypothetical protein